MEEKEQERSPARGRSFFLYSSLFSLHSSLFSPFSPATFSSEERKEKRKGAFCFAKRLRYKRIKVFESPNQSVKSAKASYLFFLYSSLFSPFSSAAFSSEERKEKREEKRCVLLCKTIAL